MKWWIKEMVAVALCPHGPYCKVLYLRECIVKNLSSVSHLLLCMIESVYCMFYSIKLLFSIKYKWCSGKKTLTIEKYLNRSFVISLALQSISNTHCHCCYNVYRLNFSLHFTLQTQTMMWKTLFCLTLTHIF